MVLGLGEIAAYARSASATWACEGPWQLSQPTFTRRRACRPGATRNRPAARSRSCGNAGSRDRRGRLSLSALSTPRHVSTLRHSRQSSSWHFRHALSSGHREALRQVGRQRLGKRRLAGAKSRSGQLGVKSVDAASSARASSLNCSSSSTMFALPTIGRSAAPAHRAGPGTCPCSWPRSAASGQPASGDRLTGRAADDHVGLGQGVGELPQLVLRQIGQHDRRVVLSGDAAQGLDHRLSRRRHLEFGRRITLGQARRPAPAGVRPPTPAAPARPRVVRRGRGRWPRAAARRVFAASRRNSAGPKRASAAPMLWAATCIIASPRRMASNLARS